MSVKYNLPAETDLAPEQVLDLARRRWQIEARLAAHLDGAERARRAAERQARDDYATQCAEGHRAHREAIMEVEALALEARLEAQQLAAGGR